MFKLLKTIITIIIITNSLTNGATAAITVAGSIGMEITKTGYQPNEQGFYKAAKDGDIAALALFAEGNVFINMKDEYGRTPVYMASSSGKANAVKYLLLQGADINARTHNLKSPLMAAIEAKSYETAVLLINANASLKVSDEKGYTALHYAVENECLGIVQYITTLYCDVDAKDEFNNTPLYYSALKPLPIVEALIKAGADLNGKNEDGKTILHHAVTSNRPETVKFLIDSGVNVNIADDTNHTPIFYARANSEIYKYLLEAGARVAK